MNHTNCKRNWVILSWNIRGINSEGKWDAIKTKILESKCDILCLQETKREFFDEAYVKKFCPPHMNEFMFLPSVGASRGSITVWNSIKFAANTIFQNQYAQSAHFNCKLTGEEWFLTNIFAPCTSDRKIDFLQWFKGIAMPDDNKWLIVGDFNLILIRRPEDRNKPGGNFQEMLAFNDDAISSLRLEELPLRGCKYTWTNKQTNPLLERLDWLFTSNAWSHGPRPSHILIPLDSPDITLITLRAQ